MLTPINITFWVTESGSGMQSPKTMGTAIQADLAAVGVNAQIQTFEWGAYLNKYGAGLGDDASMAELSWMFDSGDPAHMLPNNLYGPNCSPKGFNGGCYQNSKVDGLMDDALKVTDRDQRGAISTARSRRSSPTTRPGSSSTTRFRTWPAPSRVSGLNLHPSFYMTYLNKSPPADAGVRLSKLQRYLIQRLALVVFVLLGVTILVFLVTRLTPGDPARVLLGPRATDEQVARLRTSYGLDQPMYIQYVAWLGHVVRGDLGDSIQLHRPVVFEVGERFRGTLLLAVSAMLVAFSLGITCGVVGALRANTLLDRVLTSVLLIGISLPPFWVGLILIILFSLVLRWLPATGMLSATGGGPFDLLSHLVMPTSRLAVVPLAVIARLTRANVLEVLGQLYVRTAHAKGLPPGDSRPAPRADAIRWLARSRSSGLEAGWLLAGTVYIETVFNWPGLGLDAGQRHPAA